MDSDLEHDAPNREMEDTTDYDEADREQSSKVRSLFVNSDPNEFGEAKGHLLNVGQVVTFDYQSIPPLSKQ